MLSLHPLFDFLTTLTTLILAFFSLSLGITTVLILILYHTVTSAAMLAVGAFTRMIAKIPRLIITTPDPLATLPPFDPSTATIPALRGLLDRGRVTCGFLVEIYLDQISRHHFDVFTFEQRELIAQAHICDDMRAKGNVVGPLGGIPVLVAVKAATHELMEPDRERPEGGERSFLAGLVARKGVTHELREPDRKGTEEASERRFIGGRGLVLGFLDEVVLGEVEKWERLEEGGTVLETCVVEGLAVAVRDVEGGS